MINIEEIGMTAKFTEYYYLRDLNPNIDYKRFKKITGTNIYLYELVYQILKQTHSKIWN